MTLSQQQPRSVPPGTVILREVRPKDPLLVASVGVADPSQAQDDMDLSEGPGLTGRCTQDDGKLSSGPEPIGRGTYLPSPGSDSATLKASISGKRNWSCSQSMRSSISHSTGVHSSVRASTARRMPRTPSHLP